MASKRNLWNKAGRIVTGVVVLCFFLPFFGVSCNGMEIVTVSGADMVGGCKPGGMISEMEAQEGMGSVEVHDVDREPWAIVAMGLALVGFGVAWLRSRPALFGSFVLAIAALAAMIALYVEAKGDLDEGLKSAGGGEMSRSIEKDVEIDAGSRWGFWLTCLGFVGIAVLAGRALGEKDPPPPA